MSIQYNSLRLRVEDHFSEAPILVKKDFNQAKRAVILHKAGMGIGIALAAIAIAAGTFSLLSLSGHLPYTLKALHILASLKLGGAITLLAVGVILPIALTIIHKKRYEALKENFEKRMDELLNSTMGKLTQYAKNYLKHFANDFLQKKTYQDLAESGYLTYNNNNYSYNINSPLFSKINIVYSTRKQTITNHVQLNVKEQINVGFNITFNEWTDTSVKNSDFEALIKPPKQ